MVTLGGSEMRVLSDGSGNLQSVSRAPVAAVWRRDDVWLAFRQMSVRDFRPQHVQCRYRQHFLQLRRRPRTWLCMAAVVILVQ